jgi:hypothetical protein
MKTYRGMDVYTNVFLTSILVGSEWSASRRDRFVPEERAAGIRWIGCWVGPRDGLDAVEK